MSELISSELIAVVLSLVAPILSGLILKYKVQYKEIKATVSNIAKIAVLIDEVLKDDKISNNEATRLIQAIKEIVK